VVGPAASEIHPPARPLDLRQKKLPNSVRRDWLQKDIDLLWSVRSTLPPDPVLDVFLARFKDLSGTKEVDLDFGFERKTVRVPGGYSGCTFTIASHDARLLSMRVDCSAHLEVPETRPVVEEALGTAFVHDAPRDPAYLLRHVSYDFPREGEQARATLDCQLGTLRLPERVEDLTDALVSAYETLMSPMTDLAVGDNCGFASVPPAGREEADALQSAGRVDLLRNVLRGPNPEARVYAARALTRMDAIGPDDLRILHRLASRPIPIQSCSGCIYDWMSSAEAFASGED
jgi:hypothetical protein